MENRNLQVTKAKQRREDWSTIPKREENLRARERHEKDLVVVFHKKFWAAILMSWPRPKAVWRNLQLFVSDQGDRGGERRMGKSMEREGERDGEGREGGGAREEEGTFPLAHKSISSSHLYFGIDMCPFLFFFRQGSWTHTLSHARVHAHCV